VLDLESTEWLRALSGDEQEAAVNRLHELLLRVARREVRRRDTGPITGPELDDLACQAAGDALVAITGKLAQFRGESRFTTWACQFVVLQVSTKIGRHFWWHPSGASRVEDRERFADRFGLQPAEQSEARELAAAFRRAVNKSLTEHQRRVFVAIMLEGAPLDAVAAELGTSRNTIYKVMHDARRNLRAALVAGGFLDLELNGHDPIGKTV
jgi:RNA polymerase sigma-70 factor, ECF subfamily